MQKYFYARMHTNRTTSMYLNTKHVHHLPFLTPSHSPSFFSFLLISLPLHLLSVLPPNRFFSLRHRPGGEIQLSVPSTDIETFFANKLFLMDVLYHGRPRASFRCLKDGKLGKVPLENGIAFRMPDVTVGVGVNGKGNDTTKNDTSITQSWRGVRIYIWGWTGC